MRITVALFIGHQAGFESTTGSSNVGVGVYAAYNIKGDGGYNVCAGYAAGYHITTGDNNTALGSNAGDAITTGANNVALGVDALGLNATMSNNVAIGTYAADLASLNKRSELAQAWRQKYQLKLERL